MRTRADSLNTQTFFSRGHTDRDKTCMKIVTLCAMSGDEVIMVDDEVLMDGRNGYLK